MPIYFMIFVGTLIFVVWLTYELKKSRRNSNTTVTNFWEKESAANLTRKVSPDTLPYIHIPIETFPIGKHEDSELSKYEAVLLSLSEKKILNLTGKTATELKAAYGPANLALLDECDINYTELAKTIAAYGSCLHELGFDEECISVLEFGIAILTDISLNYKLLAELYMQKNESGKILRLKECAAGLDSLMKNNILKTLDEISLRHTSIESGQSSSKPRF